MAFSHPNKKIFALFKSWMSVRGYQNQRRFLKNHPELLDPRSIALVQQVADQVQNQRGTLTNWEGMRNFLLVLRYASQAGGTSEAIDTAFVNLFSGFSLDLPTW